MFEKVIAHMDAYLEMGIPGYDIMACKDGKCIFRHFNGYSDRENQIPMNGTERYYIYSCSKLITCTAAMQLWEKGLFSLEDKLSDYMPEFAEMTVKTEEGIRKAEKPILIRHLFEMTAGFTYNLKSANMLLAREETNGRCPTRETMKYLAKDPLLFEPGTRWNYSLCHDVLAALVEVISGQEFNAYVTEHIFKPLGMNNSTFLLPEEEKDTLAQLYRNFEEEGEIRNFNRVNSYIIGSEYASGGAGCVSTVEDYMKFLEALRIGDVILKKDTVKLMATNRLTEEQLKTFTIATHGYGLGVRCPKDENVTEFGWGGAAGAYLSIDLPHNLTIYYAQSVLLSPNRPLRSKVYNLILEEITGATAAAETAAEGAKNLTY